MSFEGNELIILIVYIAGHYFTVFIANVFSLSVFFSVFVQDILTHTILRTKGIGDVFLTLSESKVLYICLFACWYFKKLTEQSILGIEKAISQ